MQPRSDGRYEPLIQYLTIVGALLVFFYLALGAARASSPTNDEPVHFARGAVLRQTGDLSLQFEHTPLSHRLIGSLLATEPGLPEIRELGSWDEGDRLAIAAEFMWRSGLDVDRMLFLGRAPIILTGMLLGAVLALWLKAAVRSTLIAGSAASFWGLTTALAVAMILYATSANLVASAALATTDFGATITYFSTICAWWFYSQRPSRLTWFVTALLLGLALSAKLTGVLLVPVLVILAYVYPPRRPWWRPGLQALGLLPIAAVVVWLVYGFQVGPWRDWIVPAPAYWASWSAVLDHVAGGHQAFFLGQLSTEGWWLYFPVTFLIKTPVIVLVLLVVGLIVHIRSRSNWGVLAFTLLPAITLIAVAVYSRLNIGYRHILPAVPFLFLMIGVAVPSIWAKRAGRWSLAGAMIWSVVMAFTIHPHHLAYFNELIGGPAQGYRYVGDSNLDWGQDLKGLADYAANLGDDLHVSYYGTGDPAYYGLDQPSLAGPAGTGVPDFYPANPAPGRYAISAAHWQGLLPEADLFDWFRRQEPDGTIGYSILLYDVEASQPGEWIAQCLAPEALLAKDVAEQLVGRADLRHLEFDCESSWVFPDDGRPGWYILPVREMSWWPAGWSATMPVPVYRHDANQYGPGYEVYYWPGEVAPGALLGPPAEPLLTGTADLWSYASEGNEWLTLWRATAATTEPLSIMAHLYTGDANQPPLVADGLGFTSDQWQPGDWFIQRHVFAAPGTTMETGLYNYVTLEPAGQTMKLPASR